MEEKNKVFIETKNLTKRFGDVLAVNQVSLCVRRGEILGLIGENGSGKSTISSMISAIHTVTSGEMFIEGKKYQPKDRIDAIGHGIAMIVQEAGTIEALTVAENMFLGDEKRFMRHGVVNRKAMEDEAGRALEAIGIKQIDPGEVIGRYNFEDRKLVEVAKAVYYRPELFIVDETTTALSQYGRELLYRLIHKLRDEQKAVLLISHDLQELMEHCDVLTVLRDGNLIETIGKEEFDEDRIKHSMVGREIKGDYYRSDYDGRCNGEIAVCGEHLVSDVLRDVSFTLKQGQILGVAGLSGSGMHELGRAVFGIEKLRSGKVSVQKAEICSVKDALANDIGYISKDRDKEALILPASIKDNLVLANLSKMKFWITRRTEREFAKKLISDLNIKCSSMNQAVGELSGGNKQKVSFGKWIGNDSRIIVMDSPTRGVDIGVKTTMYQLITDLKHQGYAILLISEEMQELIGMCDEILIMKDGRIAGSVQRSAELNEQDIISCMI